MTRILGMRGVAALGAVLLSFFAGSTAAFGQTQTIPQAQKFDLAARPTTTLIPATNSAATQLPKVQAVLRAALNGEPLPVPAPLPNPVVPLRTGPVVMMQGGPGALLSDGLAGSNATSLAGMVDSSTVGDLDEESTCLATAVYFESKGEPLEGQLAVAQVVINRARSGRFPPTLCGVVKQHAQFSFVRAGAFPRIDEGCNAWRRARAIARIAQANLVASLPTDVLWYHADYVAPRWRQALVQFEKIGAHIFYRA